MKLWFLRLISGFLGLKLFEMELAFICILQERFVEAINHAMLLEPSPVRDLILVMAADHTGQDSQASIALQRLTAAESGKGALRAAEFAAVSGDTDQAFEWLEKIPELLTDKELNRAWPTWQIQMNSSPSLRQLRSDNRWRSIHLTVDRDIEWRRSLMKAEDSSMNAATRRNTVTSLQVHSLLNGTREVNGGYTHALTRHQERVGMSCRVGKKSF